MRLSLLLSREPFGKIIEKTLARFWEILHGQPYRVRWIPQRPELHALRDGGDQPWCANIYLNAIFTPEVENRLFASMLLEFSHSPRLWRAPFQKAYAWAATSPWGAARLTQMGMGVAPAVPDAARQMIIAGNHKLRLLDFHNGCSYAILKDGFDPAFLERELKTRRLAENLGLPVVRLRQDSSCEGWYCEDLISAAPLNRLKSPKNLHDAASIAGSALQPLLEATFQEKEMTDYATEQLEALYKLLPEASVLSEAQRQAILNRAKTLCGLVERQSKRTSSQLATALTHGDFQPANLLSNSDGVWLIDWEYSARRQCAYDALVFMLEGRSPRGLAQRLQHFIDSGPQNGSPLLDGNWLGMDIRSPDSRRLHALVFALEEIVLRVEENANPIFLRPDAGLGMLLNELQAWLPMDNAAKYASH